MRTTLAFAREVAQGRITGRITEGRITTAEQRINADLVDVLNMADQARFEGRRGVTISAAGIQAAATVIRIAYRFGIIARGRLSGLEALLPNSVLQSLAAVEEAFCNSFDCSLRKFELGRPLKEPGLPLEPPLQPAVDLKLLIDELVVVATHEGRNWSSESRGVLATQLESYHRLVILLSSLDLELANFEAS